MAIGEWHHTAVRSGSPGSATVAGVEQEQRRRLVADVPPLDVDGVRTVEVVTILWLIAFLGLLPFYGRLRSDGHGWWLWTCLAGFGLGAIGIDYCRRRRARRQR